MTTSSVSPPDPDHDWDVDLVVSWWVPASLFLMFLVLGLICRGNNTLSLDLDVSHWVQRRSAGWADPIATLGNTLGEAPVAITLLVIALVGSLLLKRQRELIFLLLVAVGRLIAVILKRLFDSPRPNELQVHLQDVFSSYGFPSGHSLTTTLSFGTLAFLLARQFPGPGIRWLLLGMWVLAICTTGFARIWVGAHWFTDTLGGALFGIALVLLAANLSSIVTGKFLLAKSNPVAS